MKTEKCIEVLKSYLPENWYAEIDNDTMNCVKVYYNGIRWDVKHEEPLRATNIDYVEIYEHEHGKCTDYICTIMAMSNGFELDECYYPLHGAEFSLNDNKYGEEQTQVNIFGTYKNFANAVRSIVSKGNSTRNHRKPIDFYV